MTEHNHPDNAPLPVKLRVEDYLLLDASGAFDGYAKTELLGGEIVFINAQHRPHALLKMKLYDALRDALRTAGSSLRPLVAASVDMPPHSTPDPDIVVTSEAEGEGLIPAASVALIIEVADTTLASDLTRKAPLYAGAGVPEYWIADLNGRVVRQFWSPGGGLYRAEREVAFATPLQAATVVGLTIATEGF